MIEHIIIFKWKSNIPDEEKQDILTSLLSLKNTIEGILELRVGHNFSTRSKGYDGGLVVTFADQKSLDDYGPHPLHQEVAKRLNAAIDDLLALDFKPIVD
ncbi:Dabb family protein [Sulfoacidibacillus ferrooxidans]|uniref:Stress-response A/B barrel domain-containing protein n=1 Tax=Sulfoacidibacillus ferrooxidans TaxID=2005001 RepID=A0A9X1V6F4_9BACL|nr:Dabb family protein [Sulfoacidibacillus ferrooxidans]MCI0182506.1 hypothetical protein [Sulfoacidibacillus ferrooxidans]